MRIAIWPADNNACGNYRLRFPALALQAQGAEDIVIDAVGPRLLWDRPWDHLRTPTESYHLLGMEPYPYDVFVMQRPTLRWWAQMVPLLQAQGTRVVVDLDDLFHEASPRNFTYKSFHGYGRFGSVENISYIDEACKAADLVTCTTPAILKRYGYGHGVVLPNLVPASYLNIFGLKKPNTFGWSGVIGVHPDDLQVTGGAFASIQAPWSFHVVGSHVGVREALQISCPLSATGRVSFEEYPYALAELEIGIVPLANTRFNEAKSGLKVLEMTATGVPVIMSPTADNLRLHRMGIGLVAESRGQWHRLVEKLMHNEDLRTELTESGRAVMENLTYEAQCQRWLEAWTGAMVPA